jgi:hypothetical protein
VAVCSELDALSVTVRLPLRVPATDGVKVTEIVQLAPATTEDPQLLVSAKSPFAAIRATVNAPVPPLDKVTVWLLLAVPMV